MPLVVTEEQAPRTQYFAEGSDARIKCNPQGDVTVSWTDRNEVPITSTGKIFNSVRIKVEYVSYLQNIVHELEYLKSF